MDTNQNNFFSSNENITDLGKIFRMILMQSKIIALIVFLGTSISIVSYLTIEKQYKITSLVQILPSESANLSQGFSQDIRLGSTYTSDVSSIQQLYKSRNNLLQIIEKSILNIEIADLNHQEIDFIKKFNVSDYGDDYSRKLELKLNQLGYEIFSLEGDLIGKGTYSNNLKNLLLDVSIEMPKDEYLGKSYAIEILNPEKYYRTIEARFDISSPTSRSYYSNVLNQGAILKISFITNDIEKGKKALNIGNENFIEKSIEIESEQARKALNFIENRSENVTKNLEAKKARLKNFRESNKTVDVNLEIESIVENINALENQINSIDLEIERAKNDFTESNPLYLNLLNQKQTLVNQRGLINDKVQSLPVAQQQYIDLFMDVELTQQAFNELQNRKLEYSIREASTLGNMRVVDTAYLENLVSPQSAMIFVGFFVSIFLSLLIAIIRGLYFIPISNPAELEDNGILVPISGVLNKVPETSDSDDNERFSQALESLIVNIENNIKQKNLNGGKTIVITSPTSSNGKSFVSRKVAKRLSDVGSKVLLMDSDYKRGVQHKEFGKNKITSSEFFDLSNENMGDFKVEKNLYIMPRLTRVSSSFEFLYDQRFKDKIDFFLSNFDYIVMDTAPVLSVSDTLVLLNFADYAALVCRHDLSKINEIKQSMAVFNQIGKTPDGIVYNCYERPSSYYGYYGVYGNYSYQYYAKRYLYQTYDYDEKD